ncbi:MAG: hypothetical protein Q8M09_18265 [Pseudomonadota bacterium]|nr:hypothetical protein [Pseudomonadota bacterium]MDP1572925.1 hypothetical protein [Pseudomonadota bacterium]MDP1906161.1 hypothetical protein [Pseudomonadota bacterium]
MGNPFSQLLFRLIVRKCHIGQQQNDIIGLIDEWVAECVVGHQEIEWRLIELLNDDFALDCKLAGGHID